jgi:hypothetical protein
MSLQGALGMSLLWAKGPVNVVRAAWDRSLSLAEELSDAQYQVRALYGLWVFHMRLAEIQQALFLAEKLRRVAETANDVSGVLTGDRLIGVSLHLMSRRARKQRSKRSSNRHSLSGIYIICMSCALVLISE